MERSFILAIVSVLALVIVAQFFQPTGNAVRTYDFCASIRSKTQCETQSSCTWTNADVAFGNYCIGNSDSRAARLNNMMTQLDYHASEVSRLSNEMRRLLS
ncbi:MAG TPA: hypothetical protein VJB87_05115 [Candidatus Nanoarchaeia archaeon]|nr:hypothetical protein [Candidatus Nanoarchaeia archaeon]